MENNWNSMETAPEDGSEFLALFLGEYVICRWHEGGEYWSGMNVKWVDGSQTHAMLRDGLGRGGPDCWQPLPAKP
jgi:hypothetical protein